jgi:hypothetical protein
LPTNELAPAWVTVNDKPAIVSVPVREPPALAATLKPTEPFPVPLPPDVMVIHVALLVAVQVQLPGVVTLTLPEAPVLGTF